jgi:hypothetical protein
MNLKYFIPILLITMICDRIEAKCISNVTTTNSLTNSMHTTIQVSTYEIIATTLYTEPLTQFEIIATTLYTEPLTQFEIIATTLYTEIPTKTTTFLIGYSPTTTTTPIPSVCNNSPFQILPFIEFNSQAIQDLNIAIISTIKLEPVKQSVTCACANRCQLGINFKCVYFKSYPYVNNTNCYLYQFKSPITETLKNNLQRGIYHSQVSKMASGISKILFS